MEREVQATPQYSISVEGMIAEYLWILSAILFIVSMIFQLIN